MDTEYCGNALGWQYITTGCISMKVIPLQSTLITMCQIAWHICMAQPPWYTPF